MTSKKSKVPKRNIASALNGVFQSMRMSGLEDKLRASKTKQLEKKSNTQFALSTTGKRAGERIARQIAKGQLKSANGLETLSEKSS